MKKNLIILFCTLLMMAPFWSVAQLSSNQQIPTGWIKGLSTKEDIIIGVDTIIKRGGRASAFIKAPGIAYNGYGAIIQYFDAAPYRGNRLKVTVFVKGQELYRGVVFMRVYGPEDTQYEHAFKQGFEETFDWAPISLTLDIAEDATFIDFGIASFGDGTIWLDDCIVSVIEKKGKSDNVKPEQDKLKKIPPRNYLSKKLINLDFESL